METKEELQKELMSAENKATELRKKIALIEESNKPKTIKERVNSYSDILAISGADDSKDVVILDKFNDAELNVVRNFIKKLRITKVLNEGWLPKKGDRRWYNWYDVSSGFVFGNTVYDATCAGACFASRLCFKDSELAKFYAEKFKDVDEGFFDL